MRLAFVLRRVPYDDMTRDEGMSAIGPSYLTPSRCLPRSRLWCDRDALPECLKLLLGDRVVRARESVREPFGADSSRATHSPGGALAARRLA